MTARLPAALAPAEQAAALLTHCAREEQQAAGLRICDADLSGTQLECLRLRGVLFEGCRLTGCSWARADLTDVVFRRCELSNSDWRDAFFARVDFADCKAVGAGFAGTGWRAASFDGCALSYAVFDYARLRDVSFSGCDLSQASLHTCTWKNLRLDKTSLRQASLLHTPLAGLDLTGCTIDGLAVSDTNAELRGAVVTMEQAAMLARRLGIVIKP